MPLPPNAGRCEPVDPDPDPVPELEPPEFEDAVELVDDGDVTAGW
jgi:hypothetical protein